jgi:hypothetical protein
VGQRTVATVVAQLCLAKYAHLSSSTPDKSPKWGGGSLADADCGQGHAAFRCRIWGGGVGEEGLQGVTFRYWISMGCFTSMRIQTVGGWVGF